MEKIETTLGDLRALSDEELDQMAKRADHPEFVKRMLEEIKSRPAEPGDEMAFIQWGWSHT